jgi:hypothetical protein
MVSVVTNSRRKRRIFKVYYMGRSSFTLQIGKFHGGLTQVIVQTIQQAAA